jgi:hypothetical protein
MYLALLLVPACASPGSPFDPGAEEGGIRLTVENGLDRDVRVFLVRGSTPIRLGVVSGLTARTFRIPRVLLPSMATLRLRGVALAGGSVDSPELTTVPGDDVVWTLGPRLGQSSFRIR